MGLSIQESTSSLPATHSCSEVGSLEQFKFISCIQKTKMGFQTRSCSVQTLWEECLLPHALNTQSCICRPFFGGCSSSSRPMTQHLERCLCHPHTALCHPPWPSSSKCVHGYTEDRDNTGQCLASRLSITSAEFLSLYEVILCIS